MKGKKFLALAAFLIVAFVAFVGTAGAVGTGFFGGVKTEVIAGTEIDGDNRLEKNDGPAWQNVILGIGGYGSYIGSLTWGPGTVGNPIGNRILALDATTGSELQISPKIGSHLRDGYTEETPYQTEVNGLIQVIVNRPGTDPTKNNGTVLIKASNGDNPTSSVFTKYYGGTFAFGGTLAATNNNSLGQGPVGIQARVAAAKRPSAAFSVNGNTRFNLGWDTPKANVNSRQPFYLVRDIADTPGPQLAYIDAGMSSVTDTNIILHHGLGEIRAIYQPNGSVTSADSDYDLYAMPWTEINASMDIVQDYSSWSVAGAGEQSLAGQWPGYIYKSNGTDLMRFNYGSGIVGTFDSVNATRVIDGMASLTVPDMEYDGNGILRFDDGTIVPTRQIHATRLVKRGGGTLTIRSVNPSDVDQAAFINASPIVSIDHASGYTYDPITGARHTGGTEVREGTLIVEGANAPTFHARYTGYLGAVWSGWWNRDHVTTNPFARRDWGVVWKTAPSATKDSTYVSQATAGGLVNNPLTIRNEGSRVLVDRTQFFSDFKGDAGTFFTAKEFTWTDVDNSYFNERPHIFVTLDNRHSDFNGTLGAFTDGTPSSFDLVLHSARSTAGLVEAANVENSAQATLTLGNPENAITGETYVSNGVLAVAGANSIAPRGTGNLYVGPNLKSFTGSAKAVFLGLADATFTNKTTVSGNHVRKMEVGNYGSVQPIGALAAASGTTTSYQDVTIKGAMEINPQAVNESVAYRTRQYNSEAVLWTNQFPYPTWGGTVRFGGTSADYRIGGDKNNITQIIVSRGIWQLDNMPADAAANPFANVMIRQTATLSLGENVNDFGNLFDLQVDDDARIRVKVRASDLKTGESAVKAGDVPAMFTVRTIDTTWLGAGQYDKDRRLGIQLDLSGLTSPIPAGTWIKVVEAEDAVSWNNIHYLRDDSDTFYEDYAKVRPAILNNTLDLTTKVVAHVDENPYVIYLEFKESVDPTSPGTTPNPNFTFAGDSASTTSAIGGTITLVDDAGAPVASADIAVRLFHSGGVNTGDDANAIAGPKTYTTDDAGVITYEFTPADAELTAFEAGVTYVVKASADGYSPAVRNVTIPGGSAVTGSSSSGCDAGFGVFALLAATGAVTLLRKKD